MKDRAFSVVELIGVLAILVVLTALLLPRLSSTHRKPDVIQTVNDAHVTEVLVALQGLQGAVTVHLAQFGTLPSLNGAPLHFSSTYDNFGQVLLTEGVIERPFDVKLGTNSFVRLVNIASLSTASPVDGSNGAYDLRGDGKNDVVGSCVVEAVLCGVKEAEAKVLNDRVDGPQLGANGAADDLLGRVVYRKPGADGCTEVHIYIMHK